MEADAERINLAIFLLVPSEHVSFTFLRVRLKNSLELEVVQQLVHTHAERATRRLLGIYGTEDQGLAARYSQIPCVVGSLRSVWCASTGVATLSCCRAVTAPLATSLPELLRVCGVRFRVPLLLTVHARRAMSLVPPLGDSKPGPLGSGSTFSAYLLLPLLAEPTP